MITFEETGLVPELLNAVYDMGFEKPTPIQEKTIPQILNSDRDMVALAQTGTGKTAAFGLPIIQLIDESMKKVQAIVLCPTRELCLQISKDMANFSQNLKKINIVSVYGGASIETQIKDVKKGSQIVVGTPGRVNDLINRKVLKLGDIKWLVLDEADEMLTMGFKDELDAILETTPAEKQTLLFSATMPTDITDNYMKDPVEISVGKRNVGAETINHYYYLVSASHKYETLKRIIDINPDIYGIVFCRTRQETKDIADSLIRDGYNADALHGDLSQPQREHVMKRFRLKNINFLIATDVAARGLDVNNLSHIINYNLPDESEVYIHRSGRTGRAGKSGTSISIIHKKEISKLRAVEKTVSKKFERKMVPSGHEICEKQLFNLINRIEKVEVDESQIGKYLPDIYKKLSWMSNEDLIKHFVSYEFNHLLAYYKKADDLNLNVDERREEPSRRERDRDRERDNTKYATIAINLGKKDKMSPRYLIEILNDSLPGKRVKLGRIEIDNKHSLIEIDSDYLKDVTKAFKKVKHKGTPVFVESVANAKPQGDKAKRKKREKVRR